MHHYRKSLFALLLAVMLLCTPLSAYANTSGDAGSPKDATLANLSTGSGSDQDSGQSPAFPDVPVVTPMKNKPKIVIDTYKLDPNPVTAGERFTLEMTFYNTNGVNSIRNLKASLATQEVTEKSGSVFIPDDTSNTFYARYIAPEGEVSKRIRMFVVPDAQQRTYTMTVTFEYEDADGNEYTSTESFGVPVVQRTELRTGELSIPKEAMMYQPTIAPLQFYNTGKTPLYNLMVKLESDMTSENPQMFVGNFASGAQETFEVNFSPETPGEHTGKIIFSYEDVSGKEHTQEIPFTVNVAEGMDPGMMEGEIPPEEMMPPQQPPIWTNPLVWIAGLIVIVIIILLIRRRRKKKQEEALEIHD